MSGAPCSGCGEATPRGARFCPHCGAHIGAATAGERRVVTVVFADLAGFTTMAEGRDPEAVKELLDTCFGALVPVIEDHGGTVDKIIGDELMAVFGAPRAHEDDPERAVRAALALIGALERLDPSLEMRVGINTGEVLAGPVGPGGAYTVTGDTVNTAHRLVGVAGRGTVLVGERTYQATSDAITYGTPATHTLRGRREAVVVHPARSVRHRPGEQAIEGALVPMVGRGAELDALVAAVHDAVASGSSRLVTILGEAGLGKSRLVAELPAALRRSGLRARVLAVHCAPYGAESPLAPLAAVVRAALGVVREDPPATQRAAVLERLASLPELAGADHRYLSQRVLQLLRLSRPTEPGMEATPARSRRSDELISAARAVIEATAGRSPLVVVIDDAHFADPLVLDLLERYASGSGRGAAILVAVAREDLAELRPELVVAQGDQHVVLHLEPLDPDDSAELLHSTLSEIDNHMGTLAPAAAAEIVAAAGGNPLLLDQLVRYLRETGALEVVEGGWRATRDLTDAGLPDGARALLGARLDGLPPEERAVLQGAAVVGSSFRPALVEAMGIEVPPQVLERLRQRGLLEPNGSEGAYVFRHSMVRDAAYASVALGDRAERHALMARWLLEASHSDDDDAQDPSAVAHHVERAVSLGQELGHLAHELTPDATSSLVRAARAARRRDQHREAERWYQRARDLGLVDPAELVAVTLEHAATLLALRRLSDADRVFRAAEALAPEDPRVLGEAATGQGVVARLLGDAEASAAYFETGRRAWQRAGDLAGEAASVRTHGWAELVAGRPRAALPKLLRARELEEVRGGPQGITLQCLAWCEFQIGDHAAARLHLWDAMRELSAVEDRVELGWSFSLLGNSLWQEGLVAQAETVGANLLEVSRNLGDLHGEGTCLVLLSACQLEAGNVDGAREYALAALRTFTELDDPWGDATARLVLGMTERVAGNLDAATTALERGLHSAIQVASVGTEARLRTELAATRLDAGDRDGAASEARATLALVRSGGGDRDSEIRALVILAKRARDLADDPDASLLLEEAIALAGGEVRTSIWRRAVAWSAILAAEAGDVPRSERLAADALQGSWESARTWVLAQRAVAAAQKAAGNRAGAEATLTTVLGRFRESPLAFLEVVRTELRDLQTSGPGAPA